jgi:hypothetical protein
MTALETFLRALRETKASDQATTENSHLPHLKPLLEAQFVKSSIEATVSAVKVKNVGIKGVTLEVVLLENITPATSKLEKPSKRTQN